MSECNAVLTGEKEALHIRDSLVLGDSIWDMIAAQRARGLGVGLLSGGYGEEELARAVVYGTAVVFGAPGWVILAGVSIPRSA